jgi:hypothetical protein
VLFQPANHGARHRQKALHLARVSRLEDNVRSRRLHLLAQRRNLRAKQASEVIRLLNALKRAEFFVRTYVAQAQHFWLSEPLGETGSFSGFLAPSLLRFLNEQL